MTKGSLARDEGFRITAKALPLMTATFLNLATTYPATPDNSILLVKRSSPQFVKQFGYVSVPKLRKTPEHIM